MGISQQRCELILASASPRRSELLRAAGFDFRTIPVHVDESLDTQLSSHPVYAVCALASRKSCAALQSLSTSHFDGIIIAADTLVVCGGHIFGKPADAQQARAMLHALSRRAHQVITGVALERVHASVSVAHASFSETTQVYFRDLSDEEIEAYVISGQGLDKAGAYGIQTTARNFVDHIEGSYDNVVGLPVDCLIRQLDCFGAFL